VLSDISVVRGTCTRGSGRGRKAEGNVRVSATRREFEPDKRQKLAVLVAVEKPGTAHRQRVDRGEGVYSRVVVGTSLSVFRQREISCMGCGRNRTDRTDKSMSASPALSGRKQRMRRDRCLRRGRRALRPLLAAQHCGDRSAGVCETAVDVIREIGKAEGTNWASATKVVAGDAMWRRTDPD